MDTATIPSATATRAGWPEPAPSGTGHPGRPEHSPHGTGSSRVRRLLRGPEGDPWWGRPALLALLLATALAYLYDLTASGWANSFYSAAAQAGSVSWKAFFFGSLDASNAITVDKPPASLWVMALSVRLLGLSSFAILLPQVLMGVGTVAVVHATVRRWFGHGPALLAGASLALTPVAVLMFRFNNPDALLTLLMALAVWATLRAVEAGSVRWIALAGVFVGLGFLTKSLQVLLVVPAVAVVWVLFARTSVSRRLLGGLASAGAFLLSAGWWVAVVELLPASARPYIGGSQTNSFLELTFGYNGFGRIDGSETGRVGGGSPFSGGTGILRMFDASNGGQVSWLLPAALLLLVAGLAFPRRTPGTDGRRAAYVAMGLWMLVTALTFSLMAGIFHEYYTVALAPAIAALVGMGAGEAWQRRHTVAGSAVLSLATAGTAVWAFLLLSRTTAFGVGLRFTALALGLAATVLLLVLGRLHRRVVPAVAALAVVAGLAGPAAYAADTLSTGHSGSIVTAGPSTGGGPGARAAPVGRAVQAGRGAPDAASPVQRPVARAAARRRRTRTVGPGRCRTAAPPGAAREAGAATAWVACSTPRPRTPRSSRPCRTVPTSTPGSPRPSARTPRPGCSWPRSCRSWPSEGSTGPTRPPRWSSSSSTSPTGRSTTSSPEAGSAGSRAAPTSPTGSTPGSRSTTRR